MPYVSASAVVIHYEEALYQVYVPFYLLDTIPECDGQISFDGKDALCICVAQ